MSPPEGTILVVDDVPEIVELFRKLVKRLGVRGLKVIAHTDPREAIADLEREPVDIVISDLRMPHADGVEVLCAALRSRPSARRVLMTGYNEIPVERTRLIQARIDAYVAKPIETAATILLLWDLLATAGSAIETHRQHARSLEDALARGGPLPWRPAPAEA